MEGRVHVKGVQTCGKIRTLVSERNMRNLNLIRASMLQRTEYIVEIKENKNLFLKDVLQTTPKIAP